MRLTEVRIPVEVAAVGAIDDALAAAGETAWGVYEDKPTASAWLGGYFERPADARSARARLRRVLAGVARLGRATVRAMPDADWRDSYKAHFKPWRSGRLHWVPVWLRDEYELPRGHAVIWLDPGMAFGTGNHETTRLCCERLAAFAAQRRPAGRRRVIDAGCGSGILALSAARLGLGPVRAFDNDPVAVRVSEENAALNGLAGVVRFAEGDLVSGLRGRRADLVLANIQADVLRRFVRELVGAVAPGGSLVLSGILATEIDAVRRDFAAAVPTWRAESRQMGEWCDLLLARPPARR